jgi:primosomal protein N' (replication factor Y)
VVILASRGKHQALAELALQTLHRRLLVDLPEDVIIGEPAPCALAKSHGQFRFQLLLRTPKIRPLCRRIHQVMQSTTLPEEVIVTWDVDPVSLL